MKEQKSLAATCCPNAEETPWHNKSTQLEEKYYKEESMNDYSNVGLKDAFIVKYDSSGTKLLRKTFATSKSDIASGITIDSYRGIIWISGNTRGEFFRNTSTGGKDIFIVRKLNY